MLITSSYRVVYCELFCRLPTVSVLFPKCYIVVYQIHLKRLYIQGFHNIINIIDNPLNLKISSLYNKKNKSPFPIKYN